MNRNTLMRAACAALLGSFAIGALTDVKAAPKPRAAIKAPVLKAKRGYVVGRATTMAGKPLPRTEIFIGGTSAAGERTSFETKTKADGTYSVKVPNGTYRISAKAPISYNGQTYLIPLHQSNGQHDDQDSSGGIVKNFVWRLSGLRPGWSETDENSHHGGSLSLRDENSYNVTFRAAELGTLTPARFPEGSLITITVTPKGPRIDGTPAGKPVVFKQNAPWGFNPMLKGLPIGPSTVSATVTEPDGTVKPLRVVARAQPHEFVAARDKAPQPTPVSPVFNWNPSASTYTGNAAPVDLWVMY